MSAYLMTDYQTCLMAQFAVHAGYVKDARRTATLLRSANNQALKDRYDAKPVRLSQVTKNLEVAKSAIEQGVTSAGVRSEVLTVIYLNRIANIFEYQCSEGAFQDRPGYKLIVRLSVHAA